MTAYLKGRWNRGNSLSLFDGLGQKFAQCLRFRPRSFGCEVLVLALAALLSGCGTIPRARDYIGARVLYLANPEIIGPHGPLTEKQALRVIAGLETRQHVPTDILKRDLMFEQALSGTPLVLGNKVTLLEDGAVTYKAMMAAIKSATDSINLEMYIISDGSVGQEFANALIERQQHGVQVDIIYDSFGSMNTPSSFFDRMRRSGIAVLQYRPLNPLESRLPWAPAHRDHRKMLVVDGRIAFTGGINISEVYASGLHTSDKKAPLSAWRDTDIEVQGPAVAEFQRLFISEWHHQKGAPLSSRNYFPKLEREGSDILRVIGSVPERFSLIYVTLISAIVYSENNAYITDAYFAPDRQILRALEAAARRGVDVRLLLPGGADEPFIISAQRFHYDDLLRAGVKIYEWKGKMLHAKTATIDGVWSTVGTSNLDWWSIARNNEVNAIILSHPFGEQMNLMFKNDIENSRQITLDEWRHRGLMERTGECVARFLQPLL
jgi:cardiolipin synthase